MLSIDLGSTSQEFIDWQAVKNALLKGEKISVKQSGQEIGQFLPSFAQSKPMPKNANWVLCLAKG